MSEDLPPTREEALKNGVARYFTGRPCKYGHISPRYTAQRLCCECARLRMVARRADKNGKQVQYDRKWRYQNLSHMRECSTKWRENNRERHRELTRLRFERNPWIRSYNQALHRAAKLERTPPWANKEEIKSIYKRAREMSRAKGVEMHVDHIIPLRGEGVSGLHVPENLQIIEGMKNRHKGNSWES